MTGARLAVESMAAKKFKFSIVPACKQSAGVATSAQPFVEPHWDHHITHSQWNGGRDSELPKLSDQ